RPASRRRHGSRRAMPPTPRPPAGGPLPSGPTPEGSPTHVSVAEFVRRTGLSESTVRRRLADGRIPKYQPSGKGGVIAIPLAAALSAAAPPAAPSGPSGATPAPAPPRRSGPLPAWQRRSGRR
ncbi:MAG TPA: hypothetical protein VF170_14250, partial [Planctomycetaceae bacterium]